MNRRQVARVISCVVACVLVWMAGSSCRAEESQPQPPDLPPAVTPVKLDRAGILNELTDFSLAGMNRRFGPDYGFYHPKGPEKPFPDVWIAPVKESPAGAGRLAHTKAPTAST